MSHVREHCGLPSTRFRRQGSVWCCNCGKMYRLGHTMGFKCWWEIEQPDPTIPPMPDPIAKPGYA